MKKETYTKVPDSILCCKTLTPSQKLIVSYVLRWQSSGRICYETNSSLAKRFGITVASFRKHVTQMNKLDFFLSEETSALNEFGKWSNSKRILVDQEKLKLYTQSSEAALDKIQVSSDLTETLDNFEAFKEYVLAYTKGKATTKAITYYFDLLGSENSPRTKENIQSLFRKAK